MGRLRWSDPPDPTVRRLPSLRGRYDAGEGGERGADTARAAFAGDHQAIPVPTGLQVRSDLYDVQSVAVLVAEAEHGRHTLPEPHDRVRLDAVGEQIG